VVNVVSVMLALSLKTHSNNARTRKVEFVE